MKRSIVLSLVLGCGLAVSALAQDCPFSGKAKDTETKLAATTEGCPVSAACKSALASMPSMKFRIGDEETGCCKSAETLASQKGKPLQYVVGDKVFTDKGEATVQLVSVLESYSEKMKSMQFVAGKECYACPMTAGAVAKKTNTPMKYRVAGIDFDSKDKAMNAIKLASTAAEGVNVSYRVGEKSYTCKTSAGGDAAKAGKPVEFVVGKEVTGCSTTSKMNVLVARINAMTEAVARYALVPPSPEKVTAEGA